jgi:UDP-glucose 4-epimerase
MSFNKQQRILVTGAGGLIGYAVAEYLHKQGYAVMGVVRKECYSVFPTLLGDLQSDIEFLRKEMSNVGAIIHCAAVFPSTITTDEESALINRHIDHALSKLVAHYAMPIVFMSSCSVYAESATTRTSWDELDSVRPQSRYAQQKLESEQLFALHNSVATSFRIPSPFGVRQTNKNVLKIFIDRVLHGEPLRYHGTGLREQNFISAYDIALAAECALQTSAKGVFNIASDRAISMKELADLICKAAQPTTSVVESSGQPDEQEHIRVNIPIEKAWRELGWKPSTDMSSALQEIIAYRRHQVNV